jgi:hypothetical protein
MRPENAIPANPHDFQYEVATSRKSWVRKLAWGLGIVLMLGALVFFAFWAGFALTKDKEAAPGVASQPQADGPGPFSESTATPEDPQDPEDAHDGTAGEEASGAVSLGTKRTPPVVAPDDSDESLTDELEPLEKSGLEPRVDPWEKAGPASLYELRKGCNDGFASACWRAGLRYNAGRGAPQDSDAAKTYFRRGCPEQNNAEMRACKELAILLSQSALPEDQEEAAVLHSRACEGGVPPSCSALGQMYIVGKGGLARDRAKGEALYERACRDGWAGACRVLYHRLWGRGKRKQAREIRELGCKAGAQDFCP